MTDEREAMWIACIVAVMLAAGLTLWLGGGEAVLR